MHTSSSDSYFRNIEIILTIVTVILVILRALTNADLFPAITLCMFVFAMLHGMQRYGFKNIVLFVLIVCGVSWAYETMSIITGFPFGHYHYNDYLDPKVGLVPWSIMPAYFAMGYFSWSIASILIDEKKAYITTKTGILISMLAAGLMVFWDLCFDPYASTLLHIWTWEHGGAYLGVPISNYFGWFLCTFTFYILFSLCIYRSDLPMFRTEITNKLFWVLPIVMYVSYSIKFIYTDATIKNYQITTQNGHVYAAGDIGGTLSLITVLTMGAISLYALWRVLNDKKL